MQRKEKRQQQQIASEGRTRFGSNHFISVNERHQSIPRQNSRGLGEPVNRIGIHIRTSMDGCGSRKPMQRGGSESNKVGQTTTEGSAVAPTKQISGQVGQEKESKAKLFMTWIKGASRDDLAFA